MSFGSRLASIRKEKKISQSDLATGVGLHTNALGRYERGEAIPSVEVAARIAKTLDVSLDYLSELTNNELNSTTLTRINEITSMSDEEQKQIYMIVDALIRDYKAKKSLNK
jgi:transcriptional regulator with XRE-family HTH domain